MTDTRNTYNLRISRMVAHRHGGGSFVSSLVGGSAPPGSSSSDAHRPRLTRTAGVGTTRKAPAKIPGSSLRAVRVALQRCDKTVEAIGTIRNCTISLSRLPVLPHFEQTGQGMTRPIVKQVGSSAITAIPTTHAASIVDRSHQESVDLPVHTLPSVNVASTGIRLMQLNMRRSAVVTGEVRQLVAEKRLDVLLLQEPYVRKQGASRTFYGLGLSSKVAAVRSQHPWAAVVVCNPRLDILFVSQLSTPHCACAEVQAPGFSFYVASCYFQYSDDIEKHLKHLEMVFYSLRGKRLIVAVDANARSSLWGPQETDEKGALFEELIRAFGLSVVNRVDQGPTFWTTRGSSFIDVTLVSPSMSQFVGKWTVREDWTTSDHRAVDIRLRVPRAGGSDRRAATTRFDTRRANWERFADDLVQMSQLRLEVLDLTSSISVEHMARELSDVLLHACSAAMPRNRQFRKSNPWWTVELTNIKKSVYRDRRDYKEEKDELLRSEKLARYRSNLRAYKRAVRKQKIDSWRKFVTKHGNEDPWGIVYRLQADKLRLGKVLSTLRKGEHSSLSLEETAKRFLDVHIPDDRVEDDTPEQQVIRAGAGIAPNTDDAPLISEAEVICVVKTFKNKKAPGPDQIEVTVLKVACSVIPRQIVRLFNGCLQWGVFPSVWKEGSLRVLPKGEDKDEKDPKSYRPICLLSVVGKLFEKLIKSRITETCLTSGRISDRQFGFMPGKSTEDAVVELRRMVSTSVKRYAVALLFDISGAFDNVWWPLVLDSLRDRNCPKNVFEVLRSYFGDRRVSIIENSLKVSKWATRGCPQGSVLGPACWNLMFDGLLRQLEALVGNSFVAYADDLLVLIEGDSRREVEKNGQVVVDKILSWCRLAKLKISEQKTEAILLRCSELQRAPIGRRGGDRPDRKRKTTAKKVDFVSRPPTIKVGKTSIRFKDRVRYLGIHFNRNLGVRDHCRYLENKVTTLFNRIGSVARAEWGLRNRALSIFYDGVFVPIVAYAAAGWADLCTESDLRVLRSMQRKVLISITGAYRSTSFEALCVLAGKLPVDILLQRNGALYNIRKEKDARLGNLEIAVGIDDPIRRVKVEAVNMWQAEWSQSTKGRTTAAFFNNVQDRLDKPWVRPNFWVAQALTGHGDFRARLASLGLADGETCQCDSPDTVQHFLLDCKRFEPQRVALRSLLSVDEWKWPEMAHFFVSEPEHFKLFTDFCRDALWLKSQDK